MKKEDLEKENLILADRCSKLEHVVRKTLWMAARYADGRMTSSPSVFNECLHIIDGMGLENCLSPDGARDGLRYASDGDFGVYDPVSQEYAKPQIKTHAKFEVIEQDEQPKGY